MATKLGPFTHRMSNLFAILFYVESHEDEDKVNITAIAYCKTEIEDFIRFLDGVVSVEIGDKVINGFDDHLDMSRVVDVDSCLMKRIIRKSSLTMVDVNLCRGAHRKFTSIEAGILRLMSDITPEKPVIEYGYNMSGFDEDCMDSKIEASRILEQAGGNDFRVDRPVKSSQKVIPDGDSYQVVARFSSEQMDRVERFASEPNEWGYYPTMKEIEAFEKSLG